MVKKLKPATTVTQQINLLRSRSLEIDENIARQWLANVSYYRLSAYWYPARKLNANNQRIDQFEPGISFADVIALYEADRKLRTLVHDGMERVEITLRTRIGEVLCTPDPLGYTKADRFRPTFNHSQWMKTAQSRLERAGNHNEAVKHYREEYDEHYPFWVLAEVLDFADISRLFEGLKTRDQRAIAEYLGFYVNMDALSKNQQSKAKSQSPLVRWLEQLTIVRNICAHHGRLWNRSFTPAPTAALKTQPEFALLPETQSGRVFGTLLVMTQILRVASPNTCWPNKVIALINDDFIANPLVSRSALGLPDYALLNQSLLDPWYSWLECLRAAS